MEPFFDSVAAHRGGYILRPDLLDLGVTDSEIKSALQQGLIIRLRAGTYAPQTHAGLTAEEKYRLMAFAVQDKLPSDVVLSHYSASVIHTNVAYGMDLRAVHVTRLGKSTARAEAGIVHHGGKLDDVDVMESAGHRLVVPARAALESAALAGVEAGLIQISYVLRQGVEADDLAERLAQMARWPGIAKVRLSLVWASPDIESVGEGRSLYMFRVGGLPIPRLQVQLQDGQGRDIGRVDFEWEDFWHCGEFDGLVKYGRLNPYSGDRLGQVIVDEKLREDRIRALPRGMSRWVYADFNSPVATCRQIGAAMEQSRRLYGRPARTVIA